VRSPVAAVLGVLSVALLGASFVVAWAVATLGALGVSTQVLRSYELWPTRLAIRLAQVGLVGGIVSIGALVLSGIAYAAGINPTGVCGGG
jgi:hypothetical protein